MERRKKIVFTVINDLSYDQRMHRICSSLQRSGFEVTLIGRILPSSTTLPSYSFQTRRVRNVFNSGKLFYLEYNIRLFFILLSGSYDIQGAVDLDTLAANVLSSALRKRKLTYDAHEYFTEVPEVYNRPLVKKIWKTVEKLGIPRADLCYTVSPGLSGLFEREYKKVFSVIKNVPEAAGQNTMNIQQQESILPVIIYQGALNEGRCLEKLIPAVKDLEIELWIAGEGDLSRQLREQVKSAGQENQVTFLGYLNPEELKRITPLAFIGFNVLENKGLSYYYSLANKCFDYVQAGVPVLCSPFPEYEALNSEHSAFIFVQPETVSIRQSVIKLLNDKNLYQQLKEACSQAATDWTWENEEKKLLEIYEQIR